MYKKILSVMLSLFLLLNLALPVCAAQSQPETVREHTYTIVNVKSLETLAENCRLDSYSHNLVVILGKDLDLTDSSFQGIPIFCGRFEGNGYTIRGLNLTLEGSEQGFFRYLTETAVVSNLHLEGRVQPTGSAGSVGGFVGNNSGVLLNCSFAGTVSGKESVGGIAGENTVTARIENCQVSGNVFGGHFIGGIAGKNAGTIRGCENHAAVNETSRQNQVELTDITLDSVIHSEAANTVTDVGGIAGNSIGLIRDSVNHATVGHVSMGYNIGGIAGTQSGTVLNCENHGEIFGRKEVGGIVGQMEPSSVMKFEEDVLQILSRQLDKLGNAVNKATSNLQGAGESLFNKMTGMYEHIGDAKDAVKTLVPDLENQKFPNLDTIQAARNNIGSSLREMNELMEGVGGIAYNALGKVNTNLHAINDQINAMRTTIGNISETTGGSIVDRSDEDTEQDFTGKVAQCRNYGNVRGDLNCGGIAGAMALENDLDMEEDWSIRGENSLNFESELRAVILDCDNSGIIAAGKLNAGGIVGFQSLGLVKTSRNSGKLDAENADYVGGISGRSMGFVRNCFANCEISGKEYTGGIAGSAAVVSDCRALVRICSGTEKLGAILGNTEENLGEVENPISGNYYFAVQNDCGAIDGISYDGQAQPLDQDSFFLQEDLPEMFRHVTVSFQYGNGMERKFSVDFGTAFPEEWIPPIPPKEGRQSYWKGMEEADLTAVFFDMVFEQAYTNQTNVLESPAARNDLPVMLVQGVFSEDALLDAQPAQEEPSVGEKEKLLEVWQFHVSEPDHQTQIRLQLPDKADPEQIRILIRDANGSWREEQHHVLGRYGVASLSSGDNAIAVIQTERTSWLLFAAVAAGIAVLTGILITRKGKKKS